MEKILQVNQLHTSFFTSNGEVQAVRGVSFALAKGEVLGIVGESGSGKSVTSMSILQLLSDSAKIKSGSVDFKGRCISQLGKRAIRTVRGKEIAMIFQDPMTSLNPLLPVGRQVQEMLSQHLPKMRGAAGKQEVLRLFKLVRIPEAEGRFGAYPHEFSGGMRQRVLIAMALACKPDILIADEPTTALDVTIQDQILQLLRQLQSELDMSVIFITHDLGVVAEICSRVLVMYGGMVMEEAGVDALFANPLHPYTKSLLRSLPSASQDKQERLLSIPGSPPDMLRPPAGCPFAARCSEARVICKERIPDLLDLGEGHASRCVLLRADAPAKDNPFAAMRPLYINKEGRGDSADCSPR